MCKKNENEHFYVVCLQGQMFPQPCWVGGGCCWVVPLSPAGQQWAATFI